MELAWKGQGCGNGGHGLPRVLGGGGLEPSAGFHDPAQKTPVGSSGLSSTGDGSSEISGRWHVGGTESADSSPCLRPGAHAGCRLFGDVVLYPSREGAFHLNPPLFPIARFSNNTVKNLPGSLGRRTRSWVIPAKTSPVSQADQHFGPSSIPVSLLKVPVITELLRFY